MDFLGDEGRWWGKNGAILVNHDELCIKSQEACITICIKIAFSKPVQTIPIRSNPFQMKRKVQHFVS